jgi:hypothetical protein
MPPTVSLPRGLLQGALSASTRNLSYHLALSLEQHFTDRHVLTTSDRTFDVERYGAAGHASVRRTDSVAPLLELQFRGLERGSTLLSPIAWYDVEWRSHCLHALSATWVQGDCPHNEWFVVADEPEVARAFHEEVCRFASNVPNVVWVFARGYWSRSSELHAAIRTASFEDLVLAPSLEHVLSKDFERFLASKELYARHRTPHRRGALLVGPPGNGKTHAIRALLREINLTVLYVKSLKTRHSPEADSIAEVFDEARDRSPCVLVLEDLDALVSDETRSVFLNELDGFARNDGVITIATTNHPERLDPALLERPSRFDRKYFFDVPAAEERRRYLARWRDRQAPELRASDAAIALAIDRSAGFSFAYLQELTLATMMRNVELLSAGATAPIDAILGEQIEALARETRQGRSGD